MDRIRIALCAALLQAVLSVEPCALAQRAPVPGGPSTPGFPGSPSALPLRTPGPTTPPPTNPDTPDTGSLSGLREVGPEAGSGRADVPIPLLPDQAGLPVLSVLSDDWLEPGELLIAWGSVAEAAHGVDELASRYDVRPVSRSELPTLGRVVVLLRFATNAQAATLRVRLLRDHPRWLVDFNTRYRALAQPVHYARSRIALRRAPRSAPGQVVRVGLLDGPIGAISALAGQITATRVFRSQAERPAPSDHATAIAALIAGLDRRHGFRGIAPGVELYAGEVMRLRDGQEETSAAKVIAGLDWLLESQAQVIDLSLGGPPNRLLSDAIFAVLRRSVIVVAAAGNDGPRAEPSYPAAYPGVIAVTATDALDRLYRQSTHGSYISLSAPGVDVWVPDGADGRYVSGTSFAAAIGTGATALLLQRNPRLTPQEAQRTLCLTAKDLGTPGRDPAFGCGLLQIESALTFLER